MTKQLIVNFDQLKEMTGCKRLIDVERTLDKNGIPFCRGRGRIFTTINAINAAMGIEPKQERQAEKTEIVLL
ncbi:hypothetical protein KFZ76_07160 [Methylovulum psychrotolerans]|uniref:hypothetical protein n=1 Tax=Methylovulum psychrotolerans TaxID=1704499 RepID=UPI001BFF9CFB|nr:hypothetical protein [Methylovulum psychrotolerans]MBT9097490.1 hypothetical protein [Methylovulum psychrotolerans]